MADQAVPAHEPRRASANPAAGGQPVASDAPPEALAVGRWLHAGEDLDGIVDRLPSALWHETVVGLQRAVGNRTVYRLLAGRRDRSLVDRSVRRAPHRSGLTSRSSVAIQRDPPPVAAPPSWQPGADGSLRLRTPTDPAGEFAALDELVQGVPRFQQCVIGRVVAGALDLPNGRQHPVSVETAGGGTGPAASATPTEQALSDRLGAGAFFLGGAAAAAGLTRLRSGYDVFRVGQGGALTATGLRVVVSGLGPIAEGILVNVAGTVRVPQSQAVQVRGWATREQFLTDFERRALEVARRRLQESWDRLSAEQRRYGIYDPEVRRRPGDVNELGGLVAAARELAGQRRAIERLRDQERSLRWAVEVPFDVAEVERGPGGVGHAAGSAPVSPADRDRLAAAQAARTAAEAAYAGIRRQRVASFPVLAAYDADDRLDALEHLTTSGEITTATLLHLRISEMKTGIRWLQGEMRRSPDRVWSLPRILEQTAEELGLEARAVQRSWVSGHARAVRENAEFVRRAVDILAFVLSVGAVVATAGGAAPAVLAAAGAASAAADTGSAVLVGRDAAFQAAATDTDPDRQRAAMEGEAPSLAALVLAVVAAAGSVGAAGAGLRGLARQQRVEAVAAPLRDLFRRAAGIASEAEEQALRTAGNQARAGLGDELVRRLPDRPAGAASAAGPSGPATSSPRPPTANPPGAGSAGGGSTPPGPAGPIRPGASGAQRLRWGANDVEYGLDRAGAVRSYEANLRMEPNREAAIYLDPDTGEHVCVSGERIVVDTDWMQRPGFYRNQQLGGIRRRWELVEHYHPPTYLGGLFGPNMRLPSPEDFEAIAHWIRTRQTPRSDVTSVVRHRDRAGREWRSTFGYEPATNPTEPWFVRFQRNDGTWDVQRFRLDPSLPDAGWGRFLYQYRRFARDFTGT